MRTKNPPSNSYYWRAVRRIAKRLGISIPKARKKDWQKEANAERKRRTAAAKLHPVQDRKKPAPKSKKILPHGTRKPKRTTHPVRKTGGSRGTIPTRGPSFITGGDRRKLELRDYDQIPVVSDEDFEDAEDWQDEWESGFEMDWPELDDLDDMDDFLIDFDHVDEDRYQEPA